jgi:hypothetical protein
MVGTRFAIALRAAQHRVVPALTKLIINQRKKIVMPKFVIERNVPNAGKMSPKELNAISAKSCRVLENLGPQIQWQQSYVTDEKLFCVYIAPNPELIREHAVRGGFPADAIREVKTVIDPVTAE